MVPLADGVASVLRNGTSALPEELGKALAHEAIANSWGGTRTRDPGIMSAVL